MDLKSLINQLNPLERKIVPFLNKTSKVNEIIELSEMQDTQVMRALQGLEDKEILKLQSQETKIVKLAEKGKNIIQAVPTTSLALPELKIYDQLNERPRKISELKKYFSDAEIGVFMGIFSNHLEKKSENGEINLILKNSAKTSSERDLSNSLNRFMHTLNNHKQNPSHLDKIDKNLIPSIELGKRRGLVLIEISKERSFSLTELGKELTKQKIETGLIETLTTDVLKNKTWENKKFRSYDIKGNVPNTYGGRLHPLQEAINQIRRIFMDMGFKEMKGPLVETTFWCFDSMWIPQNHPAREAQDTFYLDYEGKLPEQIAKKVAISHESGGKTGSKGYGYKWNEKIAKQLLLRTHTTSTTFRYLAQKNIKAPAKYFYVGRIFRNEAIDATHLPEFHQREGFIMDEGLTLRDLMGYIKEFYSKMGITKIKFKPTYNPYTEPSMEAIGWNEQLGKWVELINSGIFRPEALEPYGINVPVIAWGLGVERLAMMIHQQKDIRNMLSASGDLSWFRKAKVIKKW